jgi:hypothetical protein
MILRTLLSLGILLVLTVPADHRTSGLEAVTGAHYEGGHWLGSFATYLVTGRGLPKKQ